MNWKYNPRRKIVVGQIPTVRGVATLGVAYKVPPSLGPLIEQAPDMERLMRRLAEGKAVCSDVRPCNCIPCEAIRILRRIDEGRKGDA